MSYAEIELTGKHGGNAKVSLQDHQKVGDRWVCCVFSKTIRYAVRTNAVLKKTVYMHRLVLGLSDQDGNNLFPEYHVDHIDGDGLNNTRENVRLATHRMNMQNRKDRIRRRRYHAQECATGTG